MNARQFSGFSRLRIFILGLSLLFGFAATRVDAVEINTNAEGDAVIVPFWNVAGGHSTLVSVANLTKSDNVPIESVQGLFATVVTLRIFGADGAARFTGNVYLFSNQQWSFALGPDGDGHAVLVSNSPVCVLTGTADSTEIRSGETPIADDHGYFELISSGIISQTDLGLKARDHDCMSLQALWNQGEWKTDGSYGLVPGGLIRATTRMVNVDRGTLYDIPATPLIDFSDIVQHRRPGTSLPNLGSAHDAGTDSDSTTARRCSDGQCTENTFASPLDAVHYALSIDSLVANYSADPALGARSEMVLTSPLARFFQQSADYYHPLPVVEWRFLDSNGVNIADTPQFVCGTPTPAGCSSGLDLPSAVSILPVLRPEEEADNSYANDLSGAAYDAVQDDLFFHFYPHYSSDLSGAMPYNGKVEVLKSNVLNGGPTENALIGVMLTQYTNATLVEQDGEQVRANYSQAVAMKREIRPDD